MDPSVTEFFCPGNRLNQTIWERAICSPRISPENWDTPAGSNALVALRLALAEFECWRLDFFERRQEKDNARDLSGGLLADPGKDSVREFLRCTWIARS